MSEPTDDEYRDWKDLLASPGWARLKTYIDSQLSAESIEKHVGKVLDKDDETTLSLLRQITAGKRWVQAVFTYPSRRMITLGKPTDGVPAEHLGRRGAL